MKTGVQIFNTQRKGWVCVGWYLSWGGATRLFFPSQAGNLRTDWSNGNTRVQLGELANFLGVTYKSTEYFSSCLQFAGSSSDRRAFSRHPAAQPPPSSLFMLLQAWRGAGLLICGFQLAQTCEVFSSLSLSSLPPGQKISTQRKLLPTA